MHIIVREQTGLEEEAVAEDLGLSPADVVLLSFSDSDLNALAAAWKKGQANNKTEQRKKTGNTTQPTLRLANLARLRHPMSVDLFLDDTIAGSKAVLIRLLGGIDYWRYGIEEIAKLCRKKNIALALIPGDGRPDARLAALSTLDASDLVALEALFDAGGPDNLLNGLDLLSDRAHGLDTPPPIPVALPACAVYRQSKIDGAPVAVVFYRSYVLAADTGPIDLLCDELESLGLRPTALFVPTLKSAQADEFIRAQLANLKPAAIINATAFSARTDDDNGSPLDTADCPVLQVVLAGNPRKNWTEADRGLSATDLAMHVVLPELDGRLAAGVISFKERNTHNPELEFAITNHAPADDLIAAAARRCKAWVNLATKARSERKVALMLSTYPGRADQIAHAVGLDGPRSALHIMQTLQSEGYQTGATPETERELLRALTDTLQQPRLPSTEYRDLFDTLPRDFRDQVIGAWGPPEDDGTLDGDAFVLPLVIKEHVIIALQPERGEPAERKETYHDPSVPPRHSYIALYLWLTHIAKIDAMIHLGAHGTLEWLPGKAVALSNSCAPAVLLDKVPVIYPFIVNDPGEAAQAKRRLGAITIGHMTPPLISTELDQRLGELDRLINEFSSADGLDAKRRRVLAGDIVTAAQNANLDKELGLPADMPEADAIARIDSFLCDVKEMAIRDGLHVFGSKPLAQSASSDDPLLNACAEAEMSALLAALDGHFVQPGPSGAPSRGRRDVLPTGRNLTTIDPRAVPTPTATTHGKAAAEEILRRYLEDNGDWPRAIVMDLWGSATMRNGGEELSAALHLMGVRPIWDTRSYRVIGIEVLAPAELGRPRVDVTVRVSGLFRDVFPLQLTLFHSAVKAVAVRDEDTETNPLAGARKNTALNNAETPDRIFGAASGSYGAGVTDLIDSGAWQDTADLGQAYLQNSATAYRGEVSFADAAEAFQDRLRNADAFVHIHDHSEADILNSADYAAHEGGPIAAAKALGRDDLQAFHLDTSRPDSPKARTLEEECTRIILGRAVNPRWIEGQMRHGFRGAAEIATTVDNAFAYAATAGTITSSHFDRLYQAYLGDPAVAEFLAEANPAARDAMRARFLEAMKRGLWTSRLNSTNAELAETDE